MTKTFVIVASLFPIAASAAVSVLTPSQQVPSEQSRSAAVVSTHGTWRFDQLSMGPDPGGHTGATVTPETSKTGQPSQDAAASNQTGAKNNDAGSANAAKQPAENSGGKSAAPTTSSTAGQTQPSKER